MLGNNITTAARTVLLPPWRAKVTSRSNVSASEVLAVTTCFGQQPGCRVARQLRSLSADRRWFAAATAAAPRTEPSSSTLSASPHARTEVSTNPKRKPPTAIAMLNMGGPEKLDDVYDFLLRLFLDRELMQIPFQSRVAPWIAKKRTPSIKEQYAKIGGGSPILKWTRKQGAGLERILDELSPETAPHKTYVAFRYARPLTEDAIAEMMADGVTRAVAFTQYPQYSCSTTGSSLNELWRRLKVMDPENSIKWSVIDRWHSHPGLVEAFAQRIEKALEYYSAERCAQVIILFSAHSLPMSVVNRGDTYPAEVAATVHKIMDRLGHRNPYRLVWQSQVGPSAWLGPQTGPSIMELGKRGHKDLLLVPVAFTSDHIETLFELDLEYVGEAHEAGITGVRRVESLNDNPTFIRALADIVHGHLRSDRKAETTQYPLQCPGCKTEACGHSRAHFLAETWACPRTAQ